MLRHKATKHKLPADSYSDDSDDDDMSDVSPKKRRIYGSKEDIFGIIADTQSKDSDSDIDDIASKERMDPWELIADEAFKKCQSQYVSKVNAEEDSAITEKEAKERAFSSMKGVYRVAMMNSFIKQLLWFNAMKKDPVYKAVKRTVNRLIDTEDYEKEEALKYAILKRQFLFDRILDTYEFPSTEKGDDMEIEDDDSE